MNLSGDVNENTGLTPEFSINFYTIDYLIIGTDGLSYVRRFEHGFPSIIVRGTSGGGFMERAKGGIKVHQALSDLSCENYTKIRHKTIVKILELMPKKTIIRDEHGYDENIVTFFNRKTSGGIGIVLYKPFYSENEYWRHKNEGTPIYEDHIQEAHLLVVLKDSHDYEKKTSEAVVYATIDQMQAILNLSLAIAKVR